MTELSQRFQQGDVRTAQAVFSAPAYLSGLEETDVPKLRDIAVRTLAPEAHARLEELGRAIARVEKAADKFMTTNAKRIQEWGSVRDNKLLKQLKDA